MVSVTQLATFAVASAIIIAIPGPSVLFTIGRALSHGRRGALLSVVGNAVGEYAQVIAVAVGLGVVVERSIVAFTVIKFVGATYLVYLGVQAFRKRRALTEALRKDAASGGTHRVLWEGFVVGATNPKTIIFLAAALPQFVNRGAGQVPVQILILGAVFLVIAVLLDSVWAVTAGAARAWFANSPKRLERIGGAGGLMMIGLGASLAFSGRKD